MGSSKPAATTKLEISSTAQDFLALPLHRQLPSSTSKSLPHESTHYLYIKPHTPRIPTLDTPRQLFLVNIPIDATETSIKNLFAEKVGGGRVESVKFDSSGESKGKGILVSEGDADKRGKKRKRHDDETTEGGEEEAVIELGALPQTCDRDIHASGSSVVVTFIDEDSRELALKAVRKYAKKGLFSGKKEKTSVNGVAWGEENGEDPSLGSHRYRSHHRLRYPDHGALQKSVDEYMSAFNAREMSRSKELARRRAEPDEDGFITVTRGGRNGPAREVDAKVQAEELKERERKRVGGDFYRFQNREKRKEVARDLVREFERDRERVEEIRRRRGRVVPEK